MTVLRYEIEIDAPKDEVWKLLANLGDVNKFHPFVPNSYYTSDQLSGVGSSRVCEFSMNDMTVEETVIDWQEGENLTVQIAFIKGMTPPLKDMRGTLAVKANGSGSIASMEISYQPKFGVAGALMDTMMIRRQYDKMLPSVLKGLKHHAETGEEVDLRVLTQLKSFEVTAA